MFAYCNNNPIQYVDSNGRRVKEALRFEEGLAEAEEDEYEIIGVGVQLSFSVSAGVASAGVGIEFILYLHPSVCGDSGDPVVAVYVYGEGDLVIDTQLIAEAANVLLNCADLLAMDGATVVDAMIAALKLEGAITVSVFGVTANSKFQSVYDYIGWFDNSSVNIGSLNFSTASSDCCRTYGGGYSYTFGASKWWNWKLPAISKGKSYYWLVWSSEE